MDLAFVSLKGHGNERCIGGIGGNFSRGYRAPCIILAFVGFCFSGYTMDSGIGACFNRLPAAGVGDLVMATDRHEGKA